MFVLIAGAGSTARADTLNVMAAQLRGAAGPPSTWRDPNRSGGAAVLVPGFLPEDNADRQPLVADDRVFVCQARLDNRDDLVARLGVALPERSSMADSTLLCMAYDRWGEDCVQRLTGDFAFAVWHRRQDRIVAAVDPIGARRLFWSRVHGGLLVTGQLAALLVHREVSPVPDLHALAGLLDMGIDRASTPFESVRALPGGHRLEWRDGEVRVSRWWHPETAPMIRYRDPNDYVDHARGLFERAVEAQLRSTGQISSTLSGGLDSGLVTTTAARQLRSRGAGLTAYTSVPSLGLARFERPGWETDDGPYAAEVTALHGNIDHRIVSTSGRCTLDLLPNFHASAWTPTKSVTNFLWLEAISAALPAAGSRVLLTGQAGNTTISFPGDGAVGELLGAFCFAAALGQARREAKADGRSTLRLLASAMKLNARNAAPGFAPKPTSPGLALVSPNRRPASPRRSGFFGLRPGTRTFWIVSATTPRHVWWPDPAAQWGVDWRDPTADRELIECLLRFPMYAFRTGGRERGLARTLARGLMPDPVRLRRTRGEQVPELASLIAVHAQRYFEALETMSHSVWCKELFDLAAVRHLLQRIVGGLLDLDLASVLDRAFDVGLFLCALEGQR